MQLLLVKTFIFDIKNSIVDISKMTYHFWYQ